MEADIKSMEIVIGDLTTWEEAIAHASNYLKDQRYPNLVKISFEFNKIKYSVSKEE